MKYRQQDGAELVEFSLFAVFFFTIMLSIVDIAILGWVNLTMQHAVREGVRYAITHDSSLDPTEPQDPDTYVQQRQLAIVERIRKSSMNLSDTLITSIDVNGTELNSEVQAGDFGNSGDIIEIRFNCEWPLLTPFMKPIFPDGIYSFSVGTTMRNEHLPSTS